MNCVFDVSLDSGKMNVSWGNAHRHLGGVELRLVEHVFWEGVDEVHVTIRLPVATDNWLSGDITPGSLWSGHHRESAGSAMLSLESTDVSSGSPATSGLLGTAEGRVLIVVDHIVVGVSRDVERGTHLELGGSSWGSSLIVHSNSQLVLIHSCAAQVVLRNTGVLQAHANVAVSASAGHLGGESAVVVVSEGSVAGHAHSWRILAENGSLGGGLTDLAALERHRNVSS